MVSKVRLNRQRGVGNRGREGMMVNVKGSTQETAQKKFVTARFGSDQAVLRVPADCHLCADRLYALLTRCLNIMHHAWCRPFRAPPRELNMVASSFDVYFLPPPSHISIVVVQSSILSIVINPLEVLIEFAGLMACKLEIANARWGLGWVGRRTERIRLHWDEFFSSGAQLTLSTSY